jgi:hypothetical protein
MEFFEVVDKRRNVRGFRASRKMLYISYFYCQEKEA